MDFLAFERHVVLNRRKKYGSWSTGRPELKYYFTEQTYEYYVNCGCTNEMTVWSSQLWLRFKQSQLSQKNVFGASTGFEPMASALALQCSTNWAMKIHTLGVRQFVEFIIPWKEWNIWILCELRTYKRNEGVIIAVVSAIQAIAIKTDSVQSSSNTCKNYLQKIYSQHGCFFNAIWNI